jgi:hypothetical protein
MTNKLYSGTIFLIISYIMFILYGCQELNTPKSLHRIDILTAFKNKNTINLSSIAENIQYVQLETKKGVQLGHSPRFYLNESYIIAFAAKQIYLFNRQTGKFIREIGHFGQDPGGYRNTIFNYPYDDEKQICIAHGWGMNEYLLYDLKGGEIISISDLGNTFAILNDSIYVAYIKNLTGIEDKKLIILNINQNNSIVNIFPNYLKFDPSGNFAMWKAQGWFYKYSDELHFFEQFTDTIYQVTPEKLFPKFVLVMGKFAPPYEEQNKSDFLKHDVKEYIFIENIFESENYLLFKIKIDTNIFNGIYYKKFGTTKVSDSNYFINNIDSFIPLIYSTISNNYLIGYCEAFNIKKWFEDNSEKAKKLPQYLRKLEDIKENDNPVLMLVKLKE